MSKLYLNVLAPLKLSTSDVKIVSLLDETIVTDPMMEGDATIQATERWMMVDSDFTNLASNFEMVMSIDELKLGF